MRLPKSLQTLADHGIIEEVLRPLMSGKEAQIYLVVSEGEVCAAKIYKDAQERSFKNRADYVEGRKVRNSRDQRAMAKGSKYGKSRDEDTWKSTEVDMIYRLRSAGVRVPTPHTFIDGVLVMELVKDPEGNPAPRLGDLHFSADEASEIFHMLLKQVTRMLCAGVVHGDLSDFNVLLAWDGPVIIDFPQSVDPASNQNARALLLRDIENLNRFVSRFVPGLRRRPYGEELWSLYESNRLTPETKLTGNFKRSTARVDTSAVLELIGEANRDEEARRRNAGLRPGRPSSPLGRRREVVVDRPSIRSARGAEGTPLRPGGSGHGPTSRSGGPQNHRGTNSAGPSRDGRISRGPNRSGPGRGGPGRDRPDRDRPNRGASPRRENSSPKRGNAVQNSSYVSPEARKTKKLSLTLRDDSKTAKHEAPPQARSGGRGRTGQVDGQNRARSSESGSDGSSRRRNRRPRSPESRSLETRTAHSQDRGARPSTSARNGTASPGGELRSNGDSPRLRRQRRRRKSGSSAPKESDQ